jgi:hypothetical protein
VPSPLEPAPGAAQPKPKCAKNSGHYPFTSSLALSYRVSHSAQLTRYTANSNGGNGGVQVVNAGVENLTAVGSADGAVRFEVTAYCCAKNIEVTQWIGDLANASSEILIENNISIDVEVIVSRSSGAGSVVGYNYMDDGWIYTSPTWPEIGINGSHMAGSHHMLLEGNYGFEADSDYRLYRPRGCARRRAVLLGLVGFVRRQHCGQSQ